MRSKSCGLFVLVLLAPAALGQATFTVNATTDTAAGSGSSGDLRYCINQANLLSMSGGSATINFSLPASSTITLTNMLPPLNPGHDGALGANTNSLLIDGSTTTNLAINGNSLGTGIFMAYSGNITIQNLTLTSGLARGGNGGGGGGGAGLGGGLLINNLANVTAQRVTFSGLRAQGGAGAAGGSFNGGGGGANGGNGTSDASANGASGGGGLGGSGNYGGGGIGITASGGATGATPGPGGAGVFTNGASGGLGFGLGTPGGANGGGGGGSTQNGGGGGGVGGANGSGGAGGAGGFGGGGAGGARGGEFGGGGGGGSGGFGGGGGTSFDGAPGGFGGGGATNVVGGPPGGGLGGFGAGQGFQEPLEPAFGGGGLGAGGAAFVRAGGSLTLVDPVFTGSITAPGGTSGGVAQPGTGVGQGIFLGGTVTINLSAGNTQTYTGDFLGGRGTQPASADPNNDAVGNLIKAGTGTLILGNNSNAGTVTVNAGVLQMANTTTTASTSALVTVAGGTLSGGTGGGSANPFADSTQGFFNGAVKVQTGAILDPGINGAGLLTVAGDVTLQTGSTLAIALATHSARTGTTPADSNTNSRVVTPLDILFGTTLTMPIDGGGQTFTVGSTYDFFIGKDSGNVGGLPASVTFEPTDFTSPVFASEFSLSRSANGLDVILTFTPTAVPEPGSLALLGLAAATGWRLRRRKS